MIGKLPKQLVIPFTPRVSADPSTRPMSLQLGLSSPALVERQMLSISNGPGRLHSEMRFSPQTTLKHTQQHPQPPHSTQWKQVTWMQSEDRSAAAAFPSVRDLIKKMDNPLPRVENRGPAMPSAHARPKTPPVTPPKPKNLAAIFASRAAASAPKRPSSSVPGARPPTESPSRPTTPPPAPPRSTPIPVTGVIEPAPASSPSVQPHDVSSTGARSALMEQLRNHGGFGALRSRTRTLTSQGQPTREPSKQNGTSPAGGHRLLPGNVMDSLTAELARRGPSPVTHQGVSVEPGMQAASSQPASPVEKQVGGQLRSTPSSPNDATPWLYGVWRTSESINLMDELKRAFGTLRRETLA